MSDFLERLKAAVAQTAQYADPFLGREAIAEIERLTARLAEAERQRDELMDFAEMVASGRRGDCTCWVCELGRQAQDAISAARVTDSASGEGEK